MFFCRQRPLDMDNRLDSSAFTAQPNLSCFSKKDISFSPEMRYNKFEVCASIFSHTTEREFCCMRHRGIQAVKWGLSMNKSAPGDGVTLIDYLARGAGCEYVSELNYLSFSQKESLISVLAQMDPGTYPLAKWNEALSYLAKLPPQKTVEEARRALLGHYSGTSV